MENFIIGLFSEQLSTYIHGFKKEQVNASLLSGKGEISEVQVKVEPINEILESIIPFVKLASVYVSKLSFNVKSVRNIRKAPIEIAIDEVHIVLLERMKFNVPSEQMWNEMAKSLVEKAKKSGSYGLIERIRDNITIDVNRVYITFQPMGKFKTRKIGPWTPPAISVVLNSLRGVTVDEYGEEGTPDEVWRHNSRKGRQESMMRNRDANKGQRLLQPKTNMIFKRLTFEASVGVGKRSKGMSAKESFMNSLLLFANVPIQCHLAMHRRLRDNALLAVQVDVSLTNLELVVETETLSILVHALVGLQFCFLKDRSFVDPFINDGETEESLLLLNNSLSSSIEHDDDISTDFIKEIDDTRLGSLSSDHSDNFNLDSEDEDEESGTDSTTPQKTENWPILILPSGLIITEKLCISMSIQNLSVRVKYQSKVNGYIQYSMKGLVSELIWPKAGCRRGGYIQISLSHFSLLESYNDKICTVIKGGDNIKSAIYEGKQINADETFPSMEDRDIRNDPFDLRSPFPIQAFSLKATIDFLNEDRVSLSNTSGGHLFVQHEIGMNSIMMTFYPEIIDRATEHFWSHVKCDIDSRWYSAEWEEINALKHSIDFIQCFQPLPDMIGRDVGFSSEAFNVTMRLCDLKIKFPAPLSIDLQKSSDIVICFPEITFVVSLALPNQFLNNHILDTYSDINFPEIEGDINLRLQTTFNGIVVEVTPSLFRRSSKPQKIVQTKVITCLGSYERPSSENDSNVYLYISALLQNVQVDINSDVLVQVYHTLQHYVAMSPKLAKDDNYSPQIQISNQFTLSKCVTLVLRVNLIEFDCRYSQPLIHESQKEDNMNMVSIVPLLHFDAKNIEFGIKVMDVLNYFNVERTHNEITKKESVDIFVFSLEKLLVATFDSEKDETRDEHGNFILVEKEIELICIGNTNEESENRTFQFLVHKNNSIGQFIKVSFDMKSTMIRMGINVDRMLFMILQALPFEAAIFTSESSEEENESLSENIDKLLEKLFSFLHMDYTRIDAIRFDAKLADVVLVLPLYDSRQCLGLVCESAHYRLGYLKGILSHPNIEKEWKISFGDIFDGFQSRLSSRQFLSLLDQDSLQRNMIMKAPVIVKSFEMQSILHSDTIEGSVTEINISTKDLIAFKVFSSTIIDYRDRLEKLKTLVTASQSMLVERDGSKCNISPIHEILSITCKASNATIDNAAAAIKVLDRNLAKLKNEVDFSLSLLNEELAEMRLKLIEKEKDRLSSYALLVNDVCGYIRMGTTALSHQRMVSITNFWRYWGVLKGNDLILYKSPSDATPVDYVNLAGADILSLVGDGAKRRDLQKGFAIVDSKQNKRFFILETFSLYEKWVNAILRTLSSHQNTSDDFETKNMQEFDKTNEDIEVSDGLKREEDNVITESQSFASEQSETYEHDRNENTFEMKKLNLREKAKSRMSQMSIAVKKTVKIDTKPMRQLNNSSSFDHKKSEESTNNETSSDKNVLQDTNTIISESRSFQSEDSVLLCESDDIDGSKILSLREKAKSRMSQLSTAVKKNVKIDSNAIKQLNSSTFQHLRKPSSNHLEEPPLLKIRGLQHGMSPPLLKETIDLKDQKMCQITGLWVAKVSSVQIDDIISTSATKLPHVCIQLRRGEWVETNITAEPIYVTKNISQLLKFHAELSDALLCIQNDLTAAGLESLNKETNGLLFAQILHSGRLLQGLLQYCQKENFLVFNESICELLEHFINAILSSQLPLIAFELSTTFFNLKDHKALETETLLSTDTEIEALKKSYSLQEINKHFVDLTSTIKNCSISISKAKRQAKITDEISILPFRASMKQTEQNVKLSPQTQNNFAIHEALTTAMTERDEAQSQLMAERVFHTHELDQERRKVDMLEKKVDFLKNSLIDESASAAAYFLGQENIPNKNSLGKIEKAMIQDVDAELIELCRQLSSEISMRVSKELEVVRLQESRQIEREIEKAERKKLEDEVDVYKQRLQIALEEKERLIHEVRIWKESFQKIVAIEDDKGTN